MSPESDPEPLVRPAGDEAAPAPSSSPAAESFSTPAPPRGRRGRRNTRSDNMLPQRERSRSLPERVIVRLIATCGIVGIGVAIGAIMVSSNSKGWITGLVVSAVSVVLAALLWSSRVL